MPRSASPGPSVDRRERIRDSEKEVGSDGYSNGERRKKGKQRGYEVDDDVRDRTRTREVSDADEEDRRERRRHKSRDRDGHRARRGRRGEDDGSDDSDEDKNERRRSKRDRSRDRTRDKEWDRERRKERKRRERELESRSPSPSDRQRRKEAKRLVKANTQRDTEAQQARALAEVSMYSANNNPFHDSNLGEQFQWHKKREKEKKAGMTMEEIARKDAIRRMEAKEELERLNKKRADREVEMALREEEDIRMKRLAEDAQMKDWIAKEDDFQLEQARRRAGIRLREQRAKAIDFLAINLRFADVKALGRHTAAIGALAEAGKRGMTNARKREVEREEEEEGWGWADAGFEFEIDEPWRIFENLNLEDCIELEQDIKMYSNLEKSPINIEFWEAMQVVCQHHLDDLRDPEHAEGGRLFNPEVDASASEIVSGLSYQRLVELENKTYAMLRSGQPVDGEFWDLVLKKIHLEKAIAQLNSIHEVVLKNRLEQFKKRQREDAAMVQDELGGTLHGTRPENNFGGDMHADAGDVKLEERDGEADDEMDEDDWVEEYDPCMSPPPAIVADLSLEDRRLPIRLEEDELRILFDARRTVTASNYIPKSVRAKANAQNTTNAGTITSQSVSQPSKADLEAERMYREEAAYEAPLNTDESEEEFGDLDDGLAYAPPPTTYDWTDRFRPRKPRYFNRVLTGFEWSKYNQTHYDTDNPPPKVVQGYKFNIFYPDLIDKTVAPTYRIQRIPGDDETQMIIFTAGPPYEDIAFRIVRRPWEYSHRKGFRSNFDRGVLQLYFNYGRNFYRK